MTAVDVGVRRAGVATGVEARWEGAVDLGVGLGVDMRLGVAGGFGGFLSFEGGLA